MGAWKCRLGKGREQSIHLGFQTLMNFVGCISEDGLQEHPSLYRGPPFEAISLSRVSKSSSCLCWRLGQLLGFASKKFKGAFEQSEMNASNMGAKRILCCIISLWIVRMAASQPIAAAANFIEWCSCLWEGTIQVASSFPSRERGILPFLQVGIICLRWICWVPHWTQSFRSVDGISAAWYWGSRGEHPVGKGLSNPKTANLMQIHANPFPVAPSFQGHERDNFESP